MFFNNADDKEKLEEDEDIIYELEELDDLDLFEEVDDDKEAQSFDIFEGYENFGRETSTEEETTEEMKEFDDLTEDDFELPMEEAEEIEELEDLAGDDFELPMEEAEEIEELEDLAGDDFELPMEEAEEMEELGDLTGDDFELPMEETEEIEELDDLAEDDFELPMEETEDIEEFEDLTEDNFVPAIEPTEQYEELEEDEIEDMKQEYEETISDEDAQEETDQSIEEIELASLTSLRAEYVFLGLLLNNPKAISRYYFLYEDCHFSSQELDNIYRIIVFREAEQYASADAKEGFKLPMEADDTYNLQLQLKEIASEKNYDIEMVYTILKKLFILKKNYLAAPTKIIRDSILDIVNYKLYNEMTVEEVESAIEQIGVTASLSQGRLTDNATDFLLNEESVLATGAELPFPILSSVFKGIRKGETCCYAMPSNSGKSRFTINIASYLAFTQNKKVLIISNEMSEEKMRLCLITTILNNKAYQNLHGQELRKNEGELLALKFRPDKKKDIELDEDGYIVRKDNEPMEDFVERLNEFSTEFRQTIAATEWLNEQLENSIYFIHITEHTNEDIRKIIMNYYYRENIEYIFYDTLKADTENIGNGDEVKKTATILSNLAQKFQIFIGSSMQLLESSTLPVNLTINDMSASRTVKEVLDTLCLMKQINPQTLSKYEYSKIEEAKEYEDLENFADPDVRYYVCVVDKNRAGAKPTLLFRLNLAYNEWEELGYVRLKQEFLN